MNLTIVCVTLKLGKNHRYSHIHVQIILCILTLLLQAIYENAYKNYFSRNIQMYTEKYNYELVLAMKMNIFSYTMVAYLKVTIINRNKFQ